MHQLFAKVARSRSGTIRAAASCSKDTDSITGGTMHAIIYLVGLVVIVLAIINFVA